MGLLDVHCEDFSVKEGFWSATAGILQFDQRVSQE